MLEPLAVPSSGPDTSLLAEAGDHAQPSKPFHSQPMVEEQPTPAPGGQGLPAAAAAAPSHPALDPQQQQLAQRAAAGAAALTDILARVSALDTEGWFRAPVREVDAPNYYKIIRRPMCFQVMQGKVASRQYASWSEVVRDFELICSNAMKYNQKRSRIHKLALVMLRAGKKLLVEVEPEGRRAVAEMQLAPAAREGEEEGAVTGGELLLESRVAPTCMLKSGIGMASTGLTPPSGRIARSLSTLDTASTGEGHVGAVALDPPGVGAAQGPAEDGYSSYSETDLEGEGEPASWVLDQGAGAAAEALPHAGEAVLVQAELGCSEAGAAGGPAGAAGGEGAAAAKARAAGGDARPGEQTKAWREARRGVEWRVRWLELRLRELRWQRRRYVEQQAQQRQQETAAGQEALLRQPHASRPLPEWQLPGLLKHPFFQEHSVVGQRSSLAQPAQIEPLEAELQQQQEVVTTLPSTPLPPLASRECLPFSDSTPQLLIPPTPPLPAVQSAASGAAQPGPGSLAGGFGAAPGALCSPALEDPHYPARAHAALSMLGARLGAVRQEILSLQQANLSLLRVGGAGAARGGGSAGGPRGGHPLLMLPRGGLGSAHRAAGGGGRRRPGGSGGLATPRRSGLSVHTGGEDGRLGKRRRNDFFDLGDVATPTLGAPKYVERVQVKTIDTPKVRQLAPEEVKRREEALAAYATHLREGKSEAEAVEPLLEACAKAGGPGESSGEEEDTSDEAYAARHKVLEEAERARYNEVFAATGQVRNKKPTKVTKERKASAKPSRGPPFSSPAFLTPTATLPLGVAGGSMATPAGVQALPQSEAASAPWGPQHHAAAAATPSALHLASASLAAQVLQQAGTGNGGQCVGHLPLLVMPVHPAVTAAHMQAVTSAAAVQQQQAGEAAQAAAAEGEKEPSSGVAAAAAQQELGSGAGKAYQGPGADDSGADESPAVTEGAGEPPGTAAAAAGTPGAAPAAPGTAPPATLPLALLHAHLPSTLQAILPQGPPILAQLPAEAKRSRGRPRLRARK